MGYKSRPLSGRLDKHEREREVNDGCFESHRALEPFNDIENGLPNLLHTHSPSSNTNLLVHVGPHGTARIW